MQFETYLRLFTKASSDMSSHAGALAAAPTTFLSASISSDSFFPLDWQSMPNRPLLNCNASYATLTNDGGLTSPVTSNKSSNTSGDFNPNDILMSPSNFFLSTPIGKTKRINIGFESGLHNGMIAQDALGLDFPSSNVYNASEARITPDSITYSPMGGSSDSPWPLINHSHATGLEYPSRLDCPIPGSFDFNCGLQSPVRYLGIQSSPPSPSLLRVTYQTKTQEPCKTVQLKRAQTQASREMRGWAEINGGETASETTYKCGYVGCQKAFCRKEHLKRHKQTYVAINVLNSKTRANALI
ncbi:Zinc finger, C2H2-type/integrase, DNA-binding protein [Akanthomyces lecanii RCEF 1005]|uniref:Zinc finger, C2H2-type/integrase, DNA-binding protein n=1 Tax=Akanthomyces lecanii RCEF 1005 TaxID=1081108 RepID=A0A167NZT1_CORDF|nr:Zinc finger, C2H2-type/integrase, DNA-binding protein [Akanthomyces lecanii RCEF 1005]